MSNPIREINLDGTQATAEMCDTWSKRGVNVIHQRSIVLDMPTMNAAVRTVIEKGTVHMFFTPQKKRDEKSVEHDARHDNRTAALIQQ